jgi:hypothetical protein
MGSFLSTLAMLNPSAIPWCLVLLVTVEVSVGSSLSTLSVLRSCSAVSMCPVLNSATMLPVQGEVSMGTFLSTLVMMTSCPAIPR